MSASVLCLNNFLFFFLYYSFLFRVLWTMLGIVFPCKITTDVSKNVCKTYHQQGIHANCIR